MSHPVAEADELHFAETPDGWRLALHRYRPRGKGPRQPVILCGGFSCNRHFMDYDERYSLARHLAREGFDSWVLELRGRGLSYPTRGRKHPNRWTFDDLATIDVPTAVEHVAGATGQEVTWIGHSMGGMVLYAYLGTRKRTPVRAGVTIASPVVFEATSSKLAHRLGDGFLKIPFGDLLYHRWAMGAMWWMVGQGALEIGMNPKNIDRAEVGRALRLSLSDISRFKLQQFSRWAIEGVFCSVDGSVDYRAGLARVSTPLLLVAGSVDRLASPAAVRRALDHLPRGSASYVEFGREQGHAVDYGHLDLILGKAAPDEVFPAVTRWLAEASTGAGSGRAARKP